MDEWCHYPKSRHVCVNVAGGRWYSFDVVRIDGTLLSASECIRELDAIKRHAALQQEQEEQEEQSAENEKEDPWRNVCAATCGERTQWYSDRQQIQQSSSTSATTLERIESAIFHICLSSSTPETPEELMNVGCTGHGTDVWMDKRSVCCLLVIFLLLLSDWLS